MARLDAELPGATAGDFTMADLIAFTEGEDCAMELPHALHRATPAELKERIEAERRERRSFCTATARARSGSSRSTRSPSG